MICVDSHAEPNDNFRHTSGSRWFHRDDAMTLTLQIPPEAEARLIEKARSAGMDVPKYAERILETEARRPTLSEISGPIAEAFAASGMSEAELGDLLEKAKHEMRAERRVPRTK